MVEMVDSVGMANAGGSLAMVLGSRQIDIPKESIKDHPINVLRTAYRRIIDEKLVRVELITNGINLGIGNYL